MALANTIKTLHGGNNNTGKVFAKDKSDKKTYFKKLSDILTKNEPIPVFDRYNKGNFNNRVSDVISTKPNDLASRYQPENLPKTVVTKGDIPTVKNNQFSISKADKPVDVNYTKPQKPNTPSDNSNQLKVATSTNTNVNNQFSISKADKPTESIKPQKSDIQTSPPIVGAKLSPNISTVKDQNTNAPSVKAYKLPEVKRDVEKSTQPKTLEGSGFIGSENTLNRIQAKSDFQIKNKPTATTVEPSTKDKFDLSPISGPIGELLTESKNTPANFKLINEEQKKQTALLHTISIKIDKSGDSGGLMGIAGDLLDRKRGKGLPTKVAEVAKRGAGKLFDFAKRAAPYVKNNLGNLAKGAKSVLGSASSIARTAATSGLASNATLTAGRMLARATPVGLAVTTGAAIGTTIGSKIYEKYQNTDFMKGVGSTIAKGAAFFGNKEAQQAVSDTKKYEGLGSIASKYETSGKGAGTVSTGNGDKGGVSYGSYQLSSKTGDADKFLKKSGYDKQFAGLKPGSPEFSAKWKEVAASDPNFAKAQQKHAESEHFDPQVAKLKKNGIDIADKGKAVQEAILSSGNQYGANSDVMVKALKGKDTKNMSQEDIINAVQDYKKSTVETRFKSSPKLWDGLKKRADSERADLLAVAKAEREGTLKDPTKDSKQSTTLVAKGKAVDTKVMDAKTKDSTDKPVVAKVDKNKPANTKGTPVAANKELVAKSEPSKGKPKKASSTIDVNASGAKVAVNTPSVSMPSVGTQSLSPSGKGFDIPGTGNMSLSANKDGASVSSNGEAIAVASNKPNISEDLMQRLQPKQNTSSITNLSPSNKSELLATAYTENTSPATQPPPTPTQASPVAANPARQPMASAPATQSGGRVAASGKQADSKGGNDSEKLAVRNISSTMQRVLDKDFQLGV